MNNTYILSDQNLSNNQQILYINNMLHRDHVPYLNHHVLYNLQMIGFVINVLFSLIITSYFIVIFYNTISIVYSYCKKKKDDRIIIIGVTGRKRSGKDTVGKYLINKHGFYRVAFADALKEACKHIFGFSDEQVYGDDLKEVIDKYWGYSPREILQKVGTELFRENFPQLCPKISNDIWLRSVARQIEKLKEKGHTRFVITDVRFDNELDFIKQYNGYTWKVKRPSIIIDSSVPAHSSETKIDNFITNCVFVNSGTLTDLYNLVDNQINDILHKLNNNIPEQIPVVLEQIPVVLEQVPVVLEQVPVVLEQVPVVLEHVINDNSFRKEPSHEDIKQFMDSLDNSVIR